MVLLFLTILFLPELSKAAENYTPLTGERSGGLTDTESFSGFINELYRYVVVISSMLAVIMLALGGFQYMGSEAYSTKQQAKERIQNAIIGLLIVISAVIILETINPGITQLSLFGNI